MLKTLAAAALCLSTLGVVGAFTQTQTGLDGTWIGESSQIAVGPEKRMFSPGEVKLVFSGTQLRATGFVTKEESDVKFTVDVKQQPKHFDYVDHRQAATFNCIYEVTGDTLTIAVPRTGPRPTSFHVDQSMSKIVLVLRRQK